MATAVRIRKLICLSIYKFFSFPERIIQRTYNLSGGLPSTNKISDGER
jgi:hypothetical protein